MRNRLCNFYCSRINQRGQIFCAERGNFEEEFYSISYAKTE